MAGKAEVKYDPDIISASEVAKLIDDLGFSATLMEDAAKTQGKLDLRVGPQHASFPIPTVKIPLNPLLQISGMTCASCVHKIESKLSSTHGVVAASVSLATNKAQVQYDPEVVGARDVVAIIQVPTTDKDPVLVSSTWNITVPFPIPGPWIPGRTGEDGPETQPGSLRRNPTVSFIETSKIKDCFISRFKPAKSELEH